MDFGIAAIELHVSSEINTFVLLELFQNWIESKLYFTQAKLQKKETRKFQKQPS